MLAAGGGLALALLAAFLRLGALLARRLRHLGLAPVVGAPILADAVRDHRVEFPLRDGHRGSRGLSNSMCRLELRAECQLETVVVVDADHALDTADLDGLELAVSVTLSTSLAGCELSGSECILAGHAPAELKVLGDETLLALRARLLARFDDRETLGFELVCPKLRPAVRIAKSLAILVGERLDPRLAALAGPLRRLDDLRPLDVGQPLFASTLDFGQALIVGFPTIVAPAFVALELRLRRILVALPTRRILREQTLARLLCLFDLPAFRGGVAHTLSSESFELALDLALARAEGRSMERLVILSNDDKALGRHHLHLVPLTPKNSNLLPTIAGMIVATKPT